jgi:hypothetical protein
MTQYITSSQLEELKVQAAMLGMSVLILSQFYVKDALYYTIQYVRASSWLH